MLTAWRQLRPGRTRVPEGAAGGQDAQAPYSASCWSATQRKSQRHRAAGISPDPAEKRQALKGDCTSENLRRRPSAAAGPARAALAPGHSPR